MDTKPTVPKASVADHGHATVRAVLAAIPFGGGAAVELFNTIIAPPIERRRQQWMNDIGSAVDRLLNDNAQIVTTLQNSESFQSVLLHASWAAVRNHQAEKLAALKNAVLNAANGTTLNDDLQLLYVRYVDELTPIHLKVLDCFVRHEGELSHLDSYDKLLAKVSEITHQEIESLFFKLICDDLKTRSLLRVSQQITDFPGLYDVTNIIAERTAHEPRIIVTDIGRRFVSFVLHDPLRD